MLSIPIESTAVTNDQGLPQDMAGASLLRFCRLIRLVRVVSLGAVATRSFGEKHDTVIIDHKLI